MDEFEGSCAGKPINAAMHSFSAGFSAGCKKFAVLASGTDDPQEIRAFAASSIINASSFLEALLNESVALAQICFEENTDQRKFLDEFKRKERSLPVSKKWDELAKIFGGSPWDPSKEPFQSFEIISSLRNELVHYKGSFHARDEAPVKKIKGLMTRFGVRSKASWVEDDCSSWVADLLVERKLLDWVCETVTALADQHHVHIGGKS